MLGIGYYDSGLSVWRLHVACVVSFGALELPPTVERHASEVNWCELNVR